MRVRRSRIQAAEFKSKPQYMANEFKNAGRGNELLKYFALIDQIRQPARVRLLAKFASRVFTLLLVQRFDPPAERLEKLVRHETLGNDIALLVELLQLRLRHEKSLYPIWRFTSRG